MELSLKRVIFSAYAILAAFIFTSLSLSALHHIAVLAAIILAFFCKSFSFNLPSSAKMLLGFSALIILSLVFSPYGFVLRDALKAKYFVFGACLVPLTIFAWEKGAFTAKKNRILLSVFLVSLILANVSGIWALFSGFHPIRLKAACHTDRACGMYGMYMTYGYGLGLLTPILIAYTIKLKGVISNGLRTLLLMAMLTSILGLFWSYCRGAWIGAFIALPLTLFPQSIKKMLLGGLFLVFMGGITFFMVPKVSDTFLSASRLFSNQVRMEQFQAALEGFKRNPLLGMGYRQFEPHSKEIKSDLGLETRFFGGHAHNNFFEHLASVGLTGTLLWLLFHFCWIWEVRSASPFYRGIFWGLNLNLFTSGLFQYTMGDGENLFLIMGLYGLSQLAAKKFF